MTGVLLITVGSRGDCEPFFALVSELIQNEYINSVTLMVTDKQCQLAPKSPKLKLVPLAFEGPPSVTSKQWGAILKRDFIPIYEKILAEARELQPAVVIASTLISLIADVPRLKIGAPLIILHLQPAITSNYYPNIYMHPKWAADCFYKLQKGKVDEPVVRYNYNTHVAALRYLLRQGLLKALNDIRLKHELPKISFQDVVDMQSGWTNNVSVVLPTNSRLTPLPPDSSPRVHIVDSLAHSYLPMNWDAENMYPDLINFLSNGEKPVVVTYGSMYAGPRADNVTRAILRGLRAANVERVVMMSGQAGIGLHQLVTKEDEDLVEWATGRVFMTKGNVQYAWLFPQCEMVLCHCGAGTVYAALKAGIPVIGTPVFADQPFYMQLLRKMNLGIHAGGIELPSITIQSVKKSVERIRKQGALESARNFSKSCTDTRNGLEEMMDLIKSISKSADDDGNKE